MTTRNRRTGGAVAANAPANGQTDPVRLRGKALAPEKEHDGGPLHWLRPMMERASCRLAVRGAAAAAVLGPTIESALHMEGTTPLAALAPTDWRALLLEFKRRKAAATSLAPAPTVPGGRNWLPLGPTMVLHGQAAGEPPVAGRISGLVIAPGGRFLYAASANGGVFRSDDGAATWVALMDAFDLDPTSFASASLVCGAIAIDPADPDRVYVGTGEGDTHEMFRRGLQIVSSLPAYRGVGPLRSDDGGGAWHPEPSTPDLAGEAFFALAVDPQNRENVVGATTAGLYRRVPRAGGFEWVRRRPNVHCAAVVTAAGAATRFYAAEWGTGVFHSTDGQNWAASGTGGFPTANVGRIALAVQPNNPNLLYAFVAATNGSVLGVFRLDGINTAWRQVTNIPAEVLGGAQGDYDLAIAVDTADPDLIYLGGDAVDTFPHGAAIYRCRVQAAGGGLSAVSPTSIGEHAHADVHVLVHTPGDPTELWTAGDGGVFINRAPRDAGTFASQNNGLACLCSNFIAQHPTDPNVLFCGLQDNGTARTGGGGIWDHVNYGDGGYCLINWADPDRVLSFLNGRVYRATDGGVDHDSWSQIWSMGWETMTQPIVSAPVSTTPADADWVAMAAGRRVYISRNFGTTWPVGMRLTLPTGQGSVFALAFASTSRVYFGTTTGEVFRADRTNNTWSVTPLHSVPAGPLGLQGLITDVAIDWSDATLASVYVSFGGRGDARRVWRFNGTLWQARSGTTAATRLLDVAHNALVVDPQAPANVYVGADIGVWHSADSGQTWEPLQNGLPDAPVYDLQIHQTQRLLRAATHGRGLYELALV